MMAQGILLFIVGIWLILQVLVGDLPARVLSWRNLVSTSSTTQVAN